MIGRVLVLLLLIAVLAAGGLVWFDYLNVIDAKVVLSPLSKYIGLQERSQPKIGEDDPINLDAERLAVRLEAINLQKLEMDTYQKELDNRYTELEQIAQELGEREKELEDQKKSLDALASDADDRMKNIEQNARLLNGMPPERAVGILSLMDDQDVIDVLRKTEEIAQAAGTSSIVSYWLSLMAPEKAAEIQRKMAGRPQSL